jgi:MFS family permease
MVRLCLLLLLGLAAQVWHLVILTFVFYSASAAFTPLFQAMIPSVLPDEKTYTSALVLSRLAYTFESMLSPLLAALALTMVVSSTLFPLAALCLAASVAALISSGLSVPTALQRRRPFAERLRRGLTIYLRTPRLRGLFTLNLALSFGLAWVLVNTVVYTGLRFGQSESYTWLMAAYGAGAAAGALSVPRILQRIDERRLILTGAYVFGALSCLIFLPLPFAALLALWAGFGAASSLVLTPGGLVLTRSAARADHPAVFAAQFSMSHAGWLLAYPAAGWLGANMAPELALGILGAICIMITLLGARIWPAEDPLERLHTHPDLPPDHPHLSDHENTSEPGRHAHVYHIDDLHLTWNGQN